MVALLVRLGDACATAGRLGVYTLASLVVGAVLVISVGPRALAYQTFIVLSASMSPEIEVGSVVVAVPVERAGLSVGDVITYQRVEEPDLPVTHRIVAMRAVPGAVMARTKGDANDVPDPWEVQLGATVLRVAFAIPIAGYILYFAQTTAGRVVTIGMPLTALAALGIHDFVAARRPAPSATKTTEAAA